MRSEPRERPELVLVAFPEVRALLARLALVLVACQARRDSLAQAVQLVPALPVRLVRSELREQPELESAVGRVRQAFREHPVRLVRA